MGWLVSFALLVDATETDSVNVSRWGLWIGLLALVLTISVINERVAMKKADRYEQILRDVIRLSAEELVRARAKAEDSEHRHYEGGRRQQERGLRSVQ